ncbi:RNA polymerase II [Lysinibacillus sp. SGAir0095]|uniref:RNA polymerase II n=1 Tax=Lysinibacillus sp. SGAir0095 TaxID=2070463 RepID=UPI0010CD5F10|nr:RNA polymerase II [Lysinibacillus sp. SGAir0095]QCR31691.1 RNA polymerase II [Lysinibacillus sp. SGAir0095]
MKYAISFLGILLLVICGNLFIQYHVFSEKLETGEDDFTYTQEIEITYRSGSLDIRQHFRNLSNQSIDISWPNLSVSTDCFLETETSCDRLNEDKTKFEASESTNASLSYIIPLDGGLTSNQLFKDIFATLKNGQAAYTTVHISTDSDVLGQWITGLPLIGSQSLSLVNYSMFGGTGDISEIYWQNGVMSIQKANDLLSIYSKNSLSPELSEQLKTFNLLNENHIAIVQGKNLSARQGKRILFLEELSSTSLNEQVNVAQVKTQYDLVESPHWLSEVIASFLTDSTFGSNKSIEMVNTLKNKMSDAQMLSWIQKLMDLKGTKLSSKELDEQLTAVLGMHTEYFAMNENTEQLYPFLFNDEREVYLEQKLNKDIKVILKDGQILYSLDAIMQGIGYQTSVGENGYYVQNETQKFRFPQGYGFYVYNDQRYNTISEPLTVLAGSFYIEETWLQRLFNIDIQKTESTISIKQK